MKAITLGREQEKLGDVDFGDGSQGGCGESTYHGRKNGTPGKQQVQSMKSSYSQQLIKFNAQFLSSLAFDSLTLTFPTLYLGSFDLAGISEL